MPTLNTGPVIAGAYADKVRRTLFALCNDLVKQGAITQEQIAYGAAQLNQLLYKIIVEKLKCDKGDIVRIVVDYDVNNGKIEWKYDTLKLEWFIRKPQEEVDKAVSETLKETK